MNHATKLYNYANQLQNSVNFQLHMNFKYLSYILLYMYIIFEKSDFKQIVWPISTGDLTLR